MSELLSKTREICNIFDIKPSRSKGQNFLIEEKVYDDIIEASNLNKDDVVLEVGPGLGFLTAKLAKKVKKVIAVELDDKLADMLQMAINSQDIDNVEIINQDILQARLEQLDEGDYKIVANLPYNITSIFLRTFLSKKNKPSKIVLMLQKEVVERIIAKAPKMSLLSVSVQFYAQARMVREVPATAFWPQPKVDSAVIDISPHEEVAIEDEKLFFRLAKVGFSAKRKMLKNNLASGLKIDAKIIENALEKSNLSLSVRAENLSLKNWETLFASIKEFVV